MTGTDDARRLREQEAELAGDVGRAPASPFLGVPCLLVRTTTLRSYPTASQSYFTCQPLTILGTEQEGGAGVVSPASSVFFALNLGSTIPPAGTLVLATFVGNRWVFRYDS